MSSKINAISSGVGGLVSTADATAILELQSDGVTKFTVSSEGAYGVLRLEASKNATGTAVDFTGIPSWVKRVTVLFVGVSTNGTSTVQIQLGTSSGVVTTGYDSAVTWGTSAVASSTGLVTGGGSATDIRSGMIFIANAYGFVYVESGNYKSAGTAVMSSGGSITLPAVMDRLRITTVNGTDTFDSGVINLILEG